ncbi:MAG TPA: type VI secretion system-associated protein TagF [Burkholderiales bacterium]|nr:type VI secretion system-associated protein TagF [Burkholderiales bacterium]
MQIAAPTVGWYGKTPSMGDFISRRLSRAIIDKLDGWLQAGMTAIREDAPDGWQQHYGAAPVWCAVLPAGIIAANACVATIAPSFDRVGRRFPFCVIVALPARGVVLDEFKSLPDYCERLSKLVGVSIRNSIDVDELDRQLDSLTSQCVRDEASVTAELSDIAAVLGDAALDGGLTTVPLTARSVFPWPDLTRMFAPDGATSYWWGNAEPGRVQCGFTHEGALDAKLFATLFGAPDITSEHDRPPG